MKNHGFKFFTGDVNWLDYGGTWVRKVGDRRFHFIRLENMDDACGSDNEGRETYVVELSEVDLDAIPGETKDSAVKSCGWGDADRPDFCTTEMIAGACFEYGARAPLHSVSTNNAHQGIRECRKESYHLTNDASWYHAAMNRPVNKIGSTAREYMTGDITSAIVRGANSDDVGEQVVSKIMAKMYVNAEGHTLGGQLPAEELQKLKDVVK